MNSELDAVVELRVVGDLELKTILSFAENIPEVTEVLMVAGGPDAIVRVHATDTDDLQRVVNLLRTNGQVTETKTMVVLASWSRMD